MYAFMERLVYQTGHRSPFCEKPKRFLNPRKRKDHIYDSLRPPFQLRKDGLYVVKHGRFWIFLGVFVPYQHFVSHEIFFNISLKDEEKKTIFIAEFHVLKCLPLKYRDATSRVIFLLIKHFVLWCSRSRRRSCF